jgi:hypothetical protein
LPAGSRRHFDGLGVIVGLAQTDRHNDEPFKDSRPPRRRFGYCLVTRAGRPPPKVVRNPLRSDLTLPSYSGSRHFKVRIGNSAMQLSVNVSLSDGAYPRPSGRGIAPVQRIRVWWPKRHAPNGSSGAPIVGAVAGIVLSFIPCRRFSVERSQLPWHLFQHEL